VLLWVVFGVYVAVWVRGHEGFLVDTMLQQGDTRIFFPFHRFVEPGLFANDPIAREVSSFVTPGVYLFYRVLTPLTGIYIVPKVVQVVCLALLLAAGWLLIQSRRAGLAAGVLLVFLMLHTPFVPYRIAGGLPRSFAFPLFAIWCAGTLTRSERTRFASALLAAFTYPPAMAMIVAGEGVHGLLTRASAPALVPWLKRYALLVLLCAVTVLAYAFFRHDSGHIHTLAEAQNEPAFGPDGRLRVLPFGEPVPAIAWTFASPYLPNGRDVVAGLSAHSEALGSANAVIAVTLLILLVALRLTPVPRATFAFFCGAVFVYVVARILAFRLYSPMRFCEYGMPAASIFLATSALGLAAPRLRPRRLRASLRNGAVLLFMGALWLLNGDGVVADNGMSSRGERGARLHAHIRQLPPESRIACHPLDADDIPYWGQRAATDGYETLTVWFTEDWKRQKERTQDTLSALYATDPEALMDYCERYGITHLLVRLDRYGPDFVAAAALFEPFTQFITEHLSSIDRHDLAMLEVPGTAVVYAEDPYRLIDVERIRAAWRGSAEPEVIAEGSNEESDSPQRRGGRGEEKDFTAETRRRGEQRD
jgi:hypothetical protein